MLVQYIYNTVHCIGGILKTNIELFGGKMIPDL